MLDPSRQGLSENDLHISNGWLHKFKTQHCIQQHALQDEADSVDRGQLAVNKMEFEELISLYTSRHVFNFDELALFYHLHPNKTLATVKRK